MKRIGWVLLALVGLLLVGNAVMSWRVESQFASRVEAIRKGGDPASIAELAPPAIPPEVNAAAKMDALAPRLAAFSKEYAAFYNTPLGKAYETRGDGQPPTAEQVAALRTILDKYTDLEQQIVAAAACNQYASTMDFSLGFNKYLQVQLPQLTRIKDVTRMVEWRTQVLEADGLYADAIERWLGALQLARLHEQEPSLVAYLVTIAVRGAATAGIYRALEAGSIDAELHDKIDVELARHDDPQALDRVLKNERAISVSASLDQINQASGAMRRLVGWGMMWHFVGPFDYYDDVLTTIGQPWPTVKAKLLAPVPGGKLPPTGHGILADLLQESIAAAVRADRRKTASVRSLRAINALQAFAAEHGREATGLDELGLPKSATMDPFSAGPLVARHTDAGWLVYSIADNGIDDGGTFKDVLDYGYGPKTPPVGEAPDENKE